ncbi:MAG: hypothetical protein Q8N08_09480 [Methanobacteriaceae archaeon]|nr:hypothetical protein [Methanobacteriaceae archaeon]
MDRGILIPIMGSILVFVIISGIILFSNSDFDQQLIEQVENGVQAEKLIPQIDKETEKLNKDANKRYQDAVANKNFENGNIASKRDYQNYLDKYENELKMISKYAEARKKFAKKEITKEEFLQEINIPKELIDMIN